MTEVDRDIALVLLKRLWETGVDFGRDICFCLQLPFF